MVPARITNPALNHERMACSLPVTYRKGRFKALYPALMRKVLGSCNLI
ncbi:MAG: hypothetical protein LBT59_16700 [Clostridiales bacterium]|nr:hypothetical protein [Clostridiales bacterium]